MSRNKGLLSSGGGLAALVIAAAFLMGDIKLPTTESSPNAFADLEQTAPNYSIEQTGSSSQGLGDLINEILGGVEDTVGDFKNSSTNPPVAPAPAESSAGNVDHPVGIDPAEARQKLDAIPERGRAPKTGYKRAEFGKAWADDVDVLYGRDGCSTRENILQRDLTNQVLHADGCRVVSGTLWDPYTGETVAFQRGQETSQEVPIDHIVSLSQAWQKGAQQWTFEKRRQFSNDPANLLATTKFPNSQKGDGDAATWQPSNKGFRCTYATAQINVIHKYGLWVTSAEKSALYANLDRC